MFYDTEEGIEELCSYHENEIQDQNRSKKYSNNEGDELDLSEQETNDKPTKTHRNEVSMLKDDTNVLLLSSTRPRRVTANQQTVDNRGLQLIDQFFIKKRTTNQKKASITTDSILPPVPINQHERCPLCDQLIPNDILEIHTNACINKTSTSSSDLLEKSQERTKNELKIKETLFSSVTRQTLASIELKRNDNETATCTLCGMQMTASRLENQHKKTCSKAYK